VRLAAIALLVLASAALAHADAREDRAAAERLCEAHDPKCDWLATLSSLERASVSRALAKRGYVVEPSPWGKVIAKVRVYNEDVFAEKSWLLQFFNHFHYTTRESVVAREVVIGEGEVWDPERVQETSRRLRDPLYSSVIAVIPVVSAEAGKVEMLVVTRDIWSLRLNTQYTFQQGKLTDLSTSLSENNFLGTRNVLAAAVSLDQGAVAFGPLFIDKNLAGQHIELRARVDVIANRDDLFSCDNPDNGVLCKGLVDPTRPPSSGWTGEGSQSTVSVTKTLWSLASEWGGGLTFTHRFAIDRQFSSTGLRQVRCPDGQPCSTRITADTPDDEKLPWIYRMRRWGISAYAARQFGGKRIKHQLSFGHGVDSQRPRLLESFPGTVAQREAFAQVVLPRSELTSVPFVGYSLFTPRYRTYRNISTFDLAEDARFGPDLDLSLGFGLELLGSDHNFQRGSAAFAWSFPWCRDGLVRPSIGASFRHQDGEWVDNTASAGVRAVSPTYRYARVVAEAVVATRWNDVSNRFYTIGSDDGLRGFAINEFFGQRLVRANVEIRSIPAAVWVLRLGGVLFYDVGGADDTLEQVQLHHDVGVGFRMLVPQTSRELFRFDLAFPLDAGVVTSAGSPRFIAGFQSAF
jgi:hypothetical protein